MMRCKAVISTGLIRWWSKPAFSDSSRSWSWPHPVCATRTIAAGQRVGTMKITLEDRTLAEVPVVAIEQVETGNIFVRTWDSLRLLFK